METKAHQLVKDTLVASYRQFFALEVPALTMPATQLALFATQSWQKHYRVAVFFQGEDAPLVGHLTRRLGPSRFLMQAYRSNLVRVIELTQLTAIKRV